MRQSKLKNYLGSVIFRGRIIIVNNTGSGGAVRPPSGVQSNFHVTIALCHYASES